MWHSYSTLAQVKWEKLSWEKATRSLPWTLQLVAGELHFSGVSCLSPGAGLCLALQLSPWSLLADLAPDLPFILVDLQVTCGWLCSYCQGCFLVWGRVMVLLAGRMLPWFSPSAPLTSPWRWHLQSLFFLSHFPLYSQHHRVFLGHCLEQNSIICRCKFKCYFHPGAECSYLFRVYLNAAVPEHPRTDMEKLLCRSYHSNTLSSGFGVHGVLRADPAADSIHEEVLSWIHEVQCFS